MLVPPCFVAVVAGLLIEDSSLQISFYRSFIDPIGLICSFWLASHSFQCARAVSCVKLIEVSLTTLSCYIPACFLVVTFRSVSSSWFSSRSVMSGLISALFPFEPLGDLLCCHREGFTLPLLDLNICRQADGQSFQGITPRRVVFHLYSEIFFLSLIMDNHPELLFYVYILHITHTYHRNWQ